VITGYTTILLDSNVSGAKALAYDAIVTGLADQAFLNKFAPNVASASFSKIVLDTFAIIPSSPKADGSQRQTATSAVAVAVASTTFLLVSIFAFGIVRRRTQHQAEQELVSTPMAKPPHLGIKRASYHDGDLGPTLFRLSINTSDTPSTTWSVSDLTSEGSTRSGYSRTTSTLEIIEEETLEDVDDPHSDDLNEQIHEYGPSPQHSQPSRGSGSRCIDTFDAVDRRNTSEDNGPNKSLVSVITQSFSQEDNEDQTVHPMPPKATAAEEAVQNVQNQEKGPSPQHSQGSESRCIETVDVVDRRNTNKDTGPHESMLSIITLSFTREDDEEQDANATLLEEMTAEEAEMMLIDILSPLSANSNLLVHDIETIPAMENEAPESIIPTESALVENTKSSGGEGLISSPEAEDSDKPAPTEHNPSRDNCSVSLSEETTNANEEAETNGVPTSTDEDDELTISEKPTVSRKDTPGEEPSKQPVAKNENSTVDTSASTRGEQVAASTKEDSSAKEDAILVHLGLAEARSFEDSIGTNMVGGDILDDDSLALTAYATDSDVSLDGWIARFLFEWSFSEKTPRSTNEPAISE
jgi:hypothetical protein